MYPCLMEIWSRDAAAIHAKGAFKSKVNKTREIGGPKMSAFCQRSYHKKCQHREVGGPKMSAFCQRSYHRKCQRRGVGGQKSQNVANVVCE